MVDQKCQPGILIQFGNLAAIDAIGDLLAALVEQIKAGARLDSLDASLELLALETGRDIEKATIFELGELYDRIEIVLTIRRAADQRLVLLIRAALCALLALRRGITLHFLEEVHTLRTEIGHIADLQVGSTFADWQADATLSFVGYLAVERLEWLRLRLWRLRDRLCSAAGETKSKQCAGRPQCAVGFGVHEHQRGRPISDCDRLQLRHAIQSGRQPQTAPETSNDNKHDTHGVYAIAQRTQYESNPFA